MITVTKCIWNRGQNAKQNVYETGGKMQNKMYMEPGAKCKTKCIRNQGQNAKQRHFLLHYGYIYTLQSFQILLNKLGQIM